MQVDIGAEENVIRDVSGNSGVSEIVTFENPYIWTSRSEGDLNKIPLSLAQKMSILITRDSNVYAVILINYYFMAVIKDSGVSILDVNGKEAFNGKVTGLESWMNDSKYLVPVGFEVGTIYSCAIETLYPRVLANPVEGTIFVQSKWIEAPSNIEKTNSLSLYKMLVTSEHTSIVSTTDGPRFY